MPHCFDIVSQSIQQVHAGNKQVVALVLIAVYTLVCPKCPFQPLRFISGIFVHDTQLPVKNAYAPLNGNKFSGRGVIAGHDVGRFTAGDLQPP